MILTRKAVGIIMKNDKPKSADKPVKIKFGTPPPPPQPPAIEAGTFLVKSLVPRDIKGNSSQNIEIYFT
jgi:hypothetical protein